MNLYAVFRDAVLEDLGLAGLTADLEREYAAELQELRSLFFGSTPVAYADEARRRAYSLSYAPKHAVIWREYVRSNWTRAPGKINSIGTGSGAEIVGVMEGLAAMGSPHVHVEWRCYDTEPRWKELLERVVHRYRAECGAKLQVETVDQMSGLWPGACTVGSLVLSELVKQDPANEFCQTVGQAIGRSTGRFLDVSMHTPPSGSPTYLSSSYQPSRFTPVACLCENLLTVINNEINTCAPRWCVDPLADEPGMQVFAFDF